MFIGKGLKYFLTLAIIKPVKIIAIFIFRKFLIPLYRVYLLVKNKTNKIFAPARNKIFYPLLNKSTIHFVLIVIAVAVIANNIAIKETQAEEFGQQTILGTMVTGFEDIVITETEIVEIITPSDYFQLAGLVTPMDGSNAQISEEDEIVTSESSAALIRPSLAGGGGSIIGQFRDDVIYYTVEGGDTVSTIAEKFGISINTVLWENKLNTKSTIKPGQKLTILPQSGLSHQVGSNETLQEIADEFEVDINEIMEFNQLADAAAIEKNQILIIPGGTKNDPLPPAPTYSSGTSSYAYSNIPPSATYSGSSNLIWPVTSRRISQYYRWGHLAIDISGNYDSPLYASAAGVVESSGWGSGYGNRVIINHGNGMKTLYGHASKLFVKAGDYVSQGQTIAMMGCTGWCTGTHIHFEVIINGSKQNPLSYL